LACHPCRCIDGVRMPHLVCRCKKQCQLDRKYKCSVLKKGWTFTGSHGTFPGFAGAELALLLPSERLAPTLSNLGSRRETIHSLDDSQLLTASRDYRIALMGTFRHTLLRLQSTAIGKTPARARGLLSYLRNDRTYLCLLSRKEVVRTGVFKSRAWRSTASGELEACVDP
jgi:hypothetical protein